MLGLRCLKVTLRVLPLARKGEGFFDVVFSKATRVSAAPCPGMGMSTQLGCKSRVCAAWGHPYAVGVILSHGSFWSLLRVA